MEKKKEEKLYPIICHANSKQSLDGVYTKFSIDDREYWVPLNKAVNVPEWVYKLYLESSWNEDNKFSGMNMDHIRAD